MKIFHYILSATDFANTRNQWHLNTWLKRIGTEDDYIFLEEQSDPSRKVFGTNTPPGPGINSIFKLGVFYKELYVNWDIYNSYEWFMFSDADCYVYPKRLKSFLNYYDISPYAPLFIGKINLLYDHPGFFQGDTHNCQLSKFLRKDAEVPHDHFTCHHGGCGWLLTREAIFHLAHYVHKHQNNLILSEHYDLAHSLWLNDCDIPMMHSRLFRTESYKDTNKFGDYIDDEVITWHYMKEEDFYYVDSLLKQSN